MLELEEALRRMGKAWFISYAYYLHGHPDHMNWNQGGADALETRLRSYEAVVPQYYAQLLDLVNGANFNRLARNGLGLGIGDLQAMLAELMLNA